MRHYYKAKEFVKTQQEKEEYSYRISKHVISVAYYALKHNLDEEQFNAYLEDICRKSYKKLYNCGCQCYLTGPLGGSIKGYEGGGECVAHAISLFKKCVKAYYEELCLYNDAE